MKNNRIFIVFLMILCLIAGGAGTYAGLQFFNNGNSSLSVASISDSGQESASTKAEFEKIEKVYNTLSEKYYKDVDEDKLLEGAIDGMVKSLDDPYSTYMDKKTAEQFTQSLDSSFQGIGAEVSMVNDKVTIVSPFKGSPAEKAGIKANDQILQINGKSVEGLDLSQAVLKIRGKKGSTVNIQVQRPGVKEPLTFKVVRDDIPIETVYSSLKEENGKKIGYLEITSFSENTADEFNSNLKKLEKKGIEGLVIDVRGNPGGYLESVEKILDGLVTKDKPYVQIEQRNGEKEGVYSKNGEKKDYPISILIDRGSASASEILAGALKEAGGYPLVGEKSFGKGTVQQALPLEDGSNLKMTTHKWLTPDGNWIHEKGIQPTIKVEQPEYYYANPIQIEETLKKDSNGTQVKNTQVMLKGLGFDPGREDGYFSEQTEKAVKEFQGKNDVKQTGEVDENTASLIQTRLLEKIDSHQSDKQLQAALKEVAE
ncbi:carboxyl-terminal processing protease [Priestia endophytica DSM 13796]|uniref:Carboxyl-terminal processing protease n=2 Tax=Priestia endophytica TaxID=135735 RepID=A0A1I5ZY92_9BACI|nr:carboxyl-terminal processing protease [Priestia endophytica DSM 13796]